MRFQAFGRVRKVNDHDVDEPRWIIIIIKNNNNARWDGTTTMCFRYKETSRRLSIAALPFQGARIGDSRVIPTRDSKRPPLTMKTTLASAVASTLAAVIGAMQMQTPLYSSYAFNALEHLSGNSPYFEPADPPRQPTPPRGCTVTRAAYLVRHAAINANDFDYETYLEPFLQKLGNTSVDWAKIPALAFLAAWEPPSFAEQELLTRTGRVEAAQLGLSLSYRYPKLRLPRRVWSSTAERTVASARGLVRGLSLDDDDAGGGDGGDGGDDGGGGGIIQVVEVPEGKRAGADSLTPYKSCEAYSSAAGSDQQRVYVDAYTKPIVARLAAAAPGFNFTTADVVAMQSLCGYDTVLRGASPFCSTDLFAPDEWLQYEYGQDVQYHYNAGYGSPYAGAIGFPWINATVGLLSAHAAAQDMYVSFTHRELPPAVLVAMGLFNNSQFSGGADVNATMPLDQINHNRAWVSSRILPFLANIAIERMNCSTGGGGGGGSKSEKRSNSSSDDAASSTFYRVLVNRSPQVLPGCFDGPAQSCSADGLQKFMQQRGDLFGEYSKTCGNSYKNSTDSVTFYTSSNNGTKAGS
ncbi:HAD-like superfamily protein [Purpureocillium lavendulum]|uniref:HAD-like superfamily protein n=1 Tax=Purpureocillium lavendulum TaxID=1247861 RepID=A0AB34FG86_9HYPO|nr:HAD-like superfamily protein [Purpureocillium lavendulum]